MTSIPVAVVGVSALFPGSSDAHGFWRDILAGKDLITDVPPSHWLVEDYYDPDPTVPDKTYCKRGAFLPKVAFDPMEFGVPPSIVPATDTAQLLSLIVAQKVLEDASQGQFASMDREKMSVILGVTSAQELLGSMASRLQKPVWLKALRDSGIPETEAQQICARMSASYVPWQESTFPGLLGNVVAGRIANRFDLRGTNAVTDAACASTLSALSMGLNELYLGQADLVIAGGVDTLNDIFMFMCFSKTPALSKSGDCRPFSDQADGTLLGEGLGMLALKRLSDAERNGDRIYAVIRGLGSSSDGRSKSVYAPLPEGQARALRRTYEAAGYGPETVELVEAHGTGTVAGDAAEFDSLKQVFGEADSEHRQWCALGSVKSQIGHTKAAAGAAGLFKAVMALHHKVLPPTIKIDRPNPKLEIEKSPFYLNTRSRPWIRDSAHPRRASVSSFGFGGSNFHVALEEYTGPGHRAWKTRATPTELVIASGNDAGAVVASAQAALERARKHGLAAAARVSQEGASSVHSYRLALVVDSVDDLAKQLEAAVGRIQKDPMAPWNTPEGSGYSTGSVDGSVAFLFPGQGSQAVGMGADMAMHYESARDAWDRAANQRFDGVSVDAVVFPPPAFENTATEAQSQRLTATEWAQPGIGVCSLATLSVLQMVGVQPAVVGGHSFGEVTALCAAGAIDEASLVAIARQRGELMRDASAIPGAMTAVPRPIEEVRPLLSDSDVVIANHNHPKQVVLSGSVEAIARIEKTLEAAGIPAKRLPVSTAFHSPLVAGSSAPFAHFLSSVRFNPPAIDVYSNAEAAPYPTNADDIRRQLADQIARPVRFVEQIEAMYAAGARVFVEVGPGAILTDLVGRTLGKRPHVAIPTDRKGKNGVTAFHEALGRLFLSGVAVDFRPLWAEYARVDETPKKTPAMTIPLDGVNYAKPYPPPGGAKDLPKPNPERPLLQAASAPASEVDMSQNDAASLAWVQAYQEAQRQTAEAHAAYQRTMAETHLAFLRAVEGSFAGMSSLLGGVPAEMALTPELAAVLPPSPKPLAAVAPVAAPVAVAPVSRPKAAPTPAPAPVVPRAVAAPVSVPEAKVSKAVGIDLERLMLEVVADKTGYPTEMLGMSMELEADLGIDSIKRVEILSAVREKAPGMPEVEASELGALRTLGQIVDRLRAALGPIAAPAAEKTVAPAPATPVPAPVLPVAAAPVPVAAAPSAAVDLERLMLEVVAEKTGYPAEMLGLGMELEADLGIDSIKRVEILSAMRERAPGLPEVDAGELGQLRTLGQIVSYMQANSGAAPAAPVAASESSGIHRQRVEAVITAAPGLGTPGLQGKVVVTDENAGVAGMVVLQLGKLGIAAEVVKVPPPDADAVIFLGGLRKFESVEAAIGVNREAFLAAKAVAARFTENGGLFVTVQATGGDFGLSGKDARIAWSAGLAGLAKTAALEWSKASVRAIDLDFSDPMQQASALVKELTEGGVEREVGLSAAGRVTLRTRICAATPAAPPLDEHSVVVVSGGARGVTAAAITELARRFKCKIALLGRTPIDGEPEACLGVSDEPSLKRALLQEAVAAGKAVTPAEIGGRVAKILANREVSATIAAIEGVGASVRYLPVDVQDPNKLSAALDGLRASWGPIAAVVHGAGVLADKKIAEKTEEQFDRVFNTKVVGLRALLHATRNDPIKVLALFSSVAARTGNLGQCDYAMANEVLNKVGAAIHHRFGISVKAIGWGPWEGGMVSPALKAHFQQMGVALIPLEVGAKIFVDEICGSTDEIETVVGGELGHGPLGQAADRAADFSVRVNAASYPMLRDHVIAGRPVIPVALVIEWFARAARAIRSDLHFTGLNDLKVLRGIKLENYESQGDPFTVRARQLSNGNGALLALELRGEGDALHYSATAEMSEEPMISGGLWSPAAGTPWSGPVYDGHVLFHGPLFQVVTGIEAAGSEGLYAQMSGGSSLGWSGDWSSDPALVDGGLQLAVLWAKQVLGGASLPMAVGQIRVHRTGLQEGPITGVVRALSVHDSRAVSEVAFFGPDGRKIVELSGIETVLRPGEKAPSVEAHPAP